MGASVMLASVLGDFKHQRAYPVASPAAALTPGYEQHEDLRLILTLTPGHTQHEKLREGTRAQFHDRLPQCHASGVLGT